MTGRIHSLTALVKLNLILRVFDYHEPAIDFDRDGFSTFKVKSKSIKHLGINYVIG